MTLHQLEWTVFDVDPQQTESFVAKIREGVTSPAESPPPRDGTYSRRGGRLNTKLRQQSTMQDIGTGAGGQLNTFWDRNFQSEAEVPWYKFQKSFLDNYEAQLSCMYIIVFVVCVYMYVCITDLVTF